MSQLAFKIRNSRYARIVAIAPLILAGLFYFSHVSGAVLPNRSVQLSTSLAGASASYVLSFDIAGSETIGSIKLQFCSQSPIIGDPCATPAGFNISAAILSAQSGLPGFTVYPPGTNSNTIVLQRASSSATGPVSVSYTLDGVINPSSDGSFYGRLQTFPTTDTSGPENDHGGLALSINHVINVTTVVPPYLLFCAGITISGFDCSTVSGDYINFGNVKSSATSSAESQLVYCYECAIRLQRANKWDNDDLR